MKLPCEECVKTNNHCCKADIPYDHVTAMCLYIEGKKVLNKDISIVQHPKFESKALIVDKAWVEKGGIDLEGKDCVFLVNGKCSIYESRPDICRLYGTDKIRCRWEAGGVKPERIAFATADDIKYYDKLAQEKSLIYKELNKG